MGIISVREKNKKKVIECALQSFIANGIEAAKITDIAKASGLTERSVFRYFETKADIVLETLLLLWNDLKEKVKVKCAHVFINNTRGTDQIFSVLQEYSNFYFSSKNALIFIEEAEIYLYRLGKVHDIEKKQMMPYYDSTGPLAAAIKNGIEDGSVDTDKDLEGLYYNTFDALLGIMQKLSVLEGAGASQQYIKNRLDMFCMVLTNSYKLKG